MTDALSFVEFLFELGAEELVLSRNEGTMAVAVIALGGGPRILALERTYRPGLKVIWDPEGEEVEIARGGDLWALWNSDRGRDLRD